MACLKVARNPLLGGHCGSQHLRVTLQTEPPLAACSRFTFHHHLPCTWLSVLRYYLKIPFSKDIFVRKFTIFNSTKICNYKLYKIVCFCFVSFWTLVKWCYNGFLLLVFKSRRLLIVLAKINFFLSSIWYFRTLF